MSFNSEWGLKWPDKVFTPIVFFLNRSAKDWPTWFRRVYLLTLPLSFPIIFVLKWSLVLVGLLAMVVAFFANYFYCTWHGQKGGIRNTPSI
jgi:hypothetical protein